MSKRVDNTEFAAGLSFIAALLMALLAAWLLSCTAQAQEDPCQWEKDQARAVCRALGRQHPECQRKVDDYKLCKAVNSDDPIGGVSTLICTTQCYPHPQLGQYCVTTCREGVA